MRPDALIAGVFDPLRRLERGGLRDRLERALAEFGTVRVHDEGALVIATADPTGGRSEAARGAGPGGPALVFADGFLEPGVGAETFDALRAAYAARGEVVVSELRGSFGLVIWDRERQAGLFARDQLGQRPAFLHSDGPVLYLATEVKPLLGLLPRRPAPDPVAVARYLAPSDLREDRLLYEGIERLGGGELVRLRGERWSRHRYWRPRYQAPLQGTFDELGEALRGRIGDAVRRSIGDERAVGLYLSGGLDSTSLAAFAGPQLAERGETLRTYSSVFPNHATMDESPAIAVVNDHFGLASRRLEVFGGSALASTLEFLDAFALPDLSPNGFFLRPLARTALEDGVRLMLTGEGGDNVFGAPLYLIADRVARGRLVDAWRLVERFPHIAYNPWRSLRVRLLRDFGVVPALPEPLQRRIELRREALPTFLAPAVRELLSEDNEARRWRRLDGPRWWAEKADHFARRIILLGAGEQTTRSERLEDVPQRHPLLSLDLVEFALRLPPDQQFDPQVTRPALRRATQGVLPDEVRMRSGKMTFDALRGQSIQSDYGAVKRLIQGPQARIRAYTEAAGVDALLERSPDRWGDLSVWSGHLMRLMVLECWLRYQEDSGFAQRFLADHALTPPELVLR